MSPPNPNPTYTYSFSCDQGYSAAMSLGTSIKDVTKNGQFINPHLCHAIMPLTLYPALTKLPVLHFCLMSSKLLML